MGRKIYTYIFADGFKVITSGRMDVVTKNAYVREHGVLTRFWEGE